MSIERAANKSLPLPDGITLAQWQALLECIREQERYAYLARIERYGTNPFMRFCLTYFQPYMRDPRRPDRFVPPGPPHLELTARLSAAAGQSDVVVAGAMGRGMAKSTYGTEWFDIYCAAHEYRRNMVIVGASSQEREYRTRLRNITRQLEGNALLRADFPGLARALDAKRQSVKWSDDELVLHNGVRIACLPLGGNIRGQASLGWRPDIVTLDDPETRKLVASPEALRGAWEWIEEDLIGSLAPGAAIVWLGTYLAYHCLLRRARLPEADGGKGWRGPECPLEDPATGLPTWPAFYDAPTIASLRMKHGSRAFEKERNLKIRADEDAVFLTADFDLNQYDPSKLQHTGSFSLRAEPELSAAERQTRTQIAYQPWYAKHGLSAGLDRRIVGDGRWEYDGQPLALYQWADLAVSVSERACYTAIVTLGVLPDGTAGRDARPPEACATGRYLVLEFIRLRLTQPEQLDLIERVLDFWHPRKQGLERQSLELALQQGILARRRLPASFFDMLDRSSSDQSKLERIASWVDPVRAGELRFNLNVQSLVTLQRPLDSAPDVRVMSQRMLRREADEFPHGAFVDGLDAAESAYSLAKKYAATGSPRGPLMSETQRDTTTLWEGW